MNVIETQLPGVVLLELQRHEDARGELTELFHVPRYVLAGITLPFVQDNWSHSRKGVLRGLHLQQRYPQGKLVTVLQGHIWDVVVDMNPASPTFAQHVAVDLYAPDMHKNAWLQLWVPPGYAHGFCVLSSSADVLYKCTDIYHPQDEGGVLWSDPQLDIAWPLKQPLVSERDQHLPTVQAWLERQPRP